MRNFKVGDKVRLIEKECKDEYYSIVEGMLEEPEILTIIYAGNGGHGEVIKVEENYYRYHPSWLEKVEVPKSKHHLLITGVYFGNSREYSWDCEDVELFDKIQIEDIVRVETTHGTQFIQVTQKLEVKNKPTKVQGEVVGLVNVEY